MAGTLNIQSSANRLAAELTQGVQSAATLISNIRDSGLNVSNAGAPINAPNSYLTGTIDNNVSINTGYETSVVLINKHNAEINDLLAQYKLKYKEYIDLINIEPKPYKDLLDKSITAQILYNTIKNKTVPIQDSDTEIETENSAAKDIASEKAKMEMARDEYNTAFELHKDNIKVKKWNLTQLYNTILNKSNAMNSLVSTLPAKERNNHDSVDSIIGQIRIKLVELDNKKKELETVESIITPEERKAAAYTEEELIAQYDASVFKTESNFSKYILYLILLLFVAGCLFYIYVVPESGNLDMFILTLGLIIIGYYLYDYVKKKMRAKK
jgi:hypothetical protein